jgi:hypothetical protein
MVKGGVLEINQISKALEEAEQKLDESFKNNNAEEFNKTKKLILRLQEKIEEVVK